MQWEFECIEKYIEGKGIDVGCGTNRLSPNVLAIDQQPNKEYSHADIVHDCQDLEIKGPIEFNGSQYEFKDNELDFIFSSHVLEDFEKISEVFMNWWKKLRAGGLMILLLPDMEACNCDICNSEEQFKYRASEEKSARYWTIEDYEKNGKGNPSHRTNVGKQYIIGMLDALSINYEIVQLDTLAHNRTCTIDIVIKKL